MPQLRSALSPWRQWVTSCYCVLSFSNHKAFDTSAVHALSATWLRICCLGWRNVTLAVERPAWIFIFRPGVGHETVDRHIPDRQRWLRARGQRRTDPTVGHAWLSLSAEVLYHTRSTSEWGSKYMPLAINLNLDNSVQYIWQQRCLIVQTVSASISHERFSVFFITSELFSPVWSGRQRAGKRWCHPFLCTNQDLARFEIQYFDIKMCRQLWGCLWGSWVLR